MIEVLVQVKLVLLLWYCLVSLAMMHVMMDITGLDQCVGIHAHPIQLKNAGSCVSQKEHALPILPLLHQQLDHPFNHL